jgi:hypothetical protein
MGFQYFSMALFRQKNTETEHLKTGDHPTAVGTWCMTGEKMPPDGSGI